MFIICWSVAPRGEDGEGTKSVIKRKAYMGYKEEKEKREKKKQNPSKVDLVYLETDLPKISEDISF